MSNVIQFTQRKIAFIGETIGPKGMIVHTPFLYKVTGEKGEEIFPRLFTIKSLDMLDDEDYKTNLALENIYEWCMEELNPWLDDNQDPVFKLYAVSLEDNRILYSLILLPTEWVGGDEYTEWSPCYIFDERMQEPEPMDLRGNNIYIVGEVANPDGVLFHTPIVNRIVNDETGTVLFPGLFRKRNLEELLEDNRLEEIMSCLFQCLSSEMEEQGIKMAITRDGETVKAVRLNFIDRSTGRVLYKVNTVESSLDGNLLVPEKWYHEFAASEFINLENAEFIQLSVEMRD